jgi:hypothetical protein
LTKLNNTFNSVAVTVSSNADSVGKLQSDLSQAQFSIQVSDAPTFPCCPPTVLPARPPCRLLDR